MDTKRNKHINQFSENNKSNKNHSMKKILLLSFLFAALPIAAINAQIVNATPFTIKIQNPVTAVKNQNMSGTCWSFGTISFLESELLRMGKGEYDLSEMFVARLIYRQKAVMHLRMQGNSFFTPGGQSHDVINIIQQFGIVPEYAYMGRPLGNRLHDHAELDTAISKYIRQIVQNRNGDRAVKLPDNWLYTVDTLLNYHLGELPSSFNYQNTRFTPRSFADKALEFDTDKYVEVTSFTHHPFYKPFILESRFNWSLGSYYNIPLNEFMMLIDSVLQKGGTLAWNGDVSEMYFDFSGGTALLPEYENVVIETELRQKLFDNLTTTVDHIMHITGIAYNTNGKKSYIIKNSWGTANRYNGFIFMSEAFLKLKTVSVLVNRDFIPKSIADKLFIQK